jgi:hypothetical protein
MNHTQIRKLIDVKLKEVGMWSTEAVELVFLTGLTESGYDYIEQLGSGPAKSFFQIEPATAHDICDNYLKFRPDKVKSMSKATGIAESVIGSSKPEYWKDILTYNIAAGIILCRYKYWRVPKSIPKEIESMGDYWKKYYNTAGGKGSKEHFLAKAATRKDV